MELYHKELDRGHYRVTKEDLGFLHTKQDHSKIIYNISQVRHGKEPLPGDGIYWVWEKIKPQDKIAVYTADCLPLIFEGEKGGAIIHAGWRGIQQGIHTLEVLGGLQMKTLVIGPSIQAQNFEVTEEFYSHFPNSSHFSEKEGKHFFDLQAQVKEDIKKFYGDINIIDSELCTFDNNQYNSYRRDNTKDRNYNYYELKE